MTQTYDQPEVYIVSYVGYVGDVSNGQSIEGVYENEADALQRARDLGGHYKVSGPFVPQGKLNYNHDEQQSDAAG